MSIKFIATDLDGTLMSPDHITITDRTKNALLRAHEKGIKIAISTGRPMCIITDVIEQIPFVDYVIQSNGACVYDRLQEKNIYECLIKSDKINELIGYFSKRDVFFDVSYNGESHYQKGTDRYFENLSFPSKFVESVSKSMHEHDNLIEYLSGNGVEKITLYSVKDEDYDEFDKKLSSLELCTSSSFKGCLEATELDANKGSAVAGVCKKLGITADEVMTFGDAGNDSPMLEFAKYSFAMQNATDDCKKSAKFIAKSNADDGLAIEVEKYCL